MVEGVFPEPQHDGLQAWCFTIYDWSGSVDTTWQDLAEALFARLGEDIVQATGSHDDQHTHGSYRRVRKRVSTFLQYTNETQSFGIRLRSRPVRDPNGFFPSDIELVFAVTKDESTRLCLAVSHDITTDRQQIFEEACVPILELSGRCYGGAFDFPAAFDPECYLSSIGAIPKGGRWSDNRLHTERITLWRDRTFKMGLRPTDGYFREVYCVNLIQQSHLAAPFRGGRLGQFAEEVGSVRKLSVPDDTYLWTIPDEKLSAVRIAMEDSGLVLSSQHEVLELESG